jgi:hypothetical protein
LVIFRVWSLNLQRGGFIWTLRIRCNSVYSESLVLLIFLLLWDWYCTAKNWMNM